MRIQRRLRYNNIVGVRWCKTCVNRSGDIWEGHYGSALRTGVLGHIFRRLTKVKNWAPPTWYEGQQGAQTRLWVVAGLQIDATSCSSLLH